MKKSKKIIVTGCAGFIGFHLCRRLIKEKYDVYGIDSLNDYYDTNLKNDRLKILKTAENFSFSKIDISRKNALKKFEVLKPQVLVNLAAQAGVRHSLSNPEDYTKNNIDGFLTILEYAKKVSLPHLVYASTSSVYGGNTKMPFSASDPVDHPLQFYAATKRANELMAHAYSNLYSIPTTGLRFFTVYGPWGRPDMALFLFTKNIIAGKKIDVFNQGNHIRDFTYVDDIVDGIIKASKKIPQLNNNWDGEQDPSSSFAPFKIYNIGGNKPIQLMDYIKEIERNLNKKAKINFLPLQAGDVIETRSDISNLINDVGYNPKTSIQKGVKNFVDWYRQYYAIEK